jgi:hypothetical protein
MSELGQKLPKWTVRVMAGTPIATTERTSRIGRFVPGPDVKWLEMLKQIAPAVTRVGVLRDPNTPSGIGQFGAMQGAASTFRVVLVPLGVRDAAEIERAVSGCERR